MKFNEGDKFRSSGGRIFVVLNVLVNELEMQAADNVVVFKIDVWLVSDLLITNKWVRI